MGLEQTLYMAVRKDEQGREFLDTAIVGSTPSAVQDMATEAAVRYPLTERRLPFVRVARVVVREVGNEGQDRS